LTAAGGTVEISIQNSLKLNQTLSPQMIQSLKLLQYSNLELEQVLRKELQENPLLEESALEEEDQEQEQQQEQENSDTQTGNEKDDEKKQDDGDGDWESQEQKEEKVIEDKEKAEDANWDDYFSDGFDLGYRRTEDERVNELYEKVPVQTASLEEHLLKQLSEKKLNPIRKEIGEFIIGNINDNGYLAESPRDIAEKLDVPVSEVNEVRHIIQHFDPLGVGSLNLQESLLVQIYVKGWSQTLMARILEDHFELLKKYHLPEIARKLVKLRPDAPQAESFGQALVDSLFEVFSPIYSGVFCFESIHTRFWRNYLTVPSSF